MSSIHPSLLPSHSLLPLTSSVATFFRSSPFVEVADRRSSVCTIAVLVLFSKQEREREKRISLTRSWCIFIPDGRPTIFIPLLTKQRTWDSLAGFLQVSFILALRAVLSCFAFCVCVFFGGFFCDNFYSSAFSSVLVCKHFLTKLSKLKNREKSFGGIFEMEAPCLFNPSGF